MTVEKIYQWTEAAIGHLTNGANRHVLEILHGLKEEAAAEIRKNAAKTNGSRDRQKAAEKVLKNAKTIGKEALCGAWVNGDAQYFSDSFAAYRLRDTIPLENIPRVDFHGVLENAFTGAEQNEKTLDLPDVPTLRAYIKTEKATKKAAKDRTPVLYRFGELLPVVNAEYLLNILEILPGAVCRCSSHSILKPLYFTATAGDAVLCPVRK